MVSKSKLRELESHTLQPIEDGSTKIDVYSLPEAEQDFLSYIQNREFDFDNLSVQDRNLLHQGGHRLFLRALDIYIQSVSQFIEEKDLNLYKTNLLMFTLKFINKTSKQRQDILFKTVMEM